MDTELKFLQNDLKNKIRYFLQRAKKQDLGEAVFEHTTTQAKKLLNTLSTNNLNALMIRTLYAETAGLLAATEWQSPSFNHSTCPQAGRQTGKVSGNITDYTRDQLIYGNWRQVEFSKQFVGSWRGIPIQVLFTQSGMGALTTILIYLLSKGQFTRPVMVGKNSYFQNKELILKILPQPVIEVDEQDTDKVLDTIKTVNPSAIFLDSLCNSANLAMPDLKKISQFLIKSQKQETYLVIDNTGLATALAPLKLIFPWRGKVKLLVFESLNKYYEYGMDRTIGGFCWGLPQDASKLFYARLHAGTIMTDTSTLMLPTANKLELNWRLKVLNKNATKIATNLQNLGAIYPKLSSHPAYRVAKTYSFGGSTITFRIKPKSLRQYENKIARLMKEATLRNIALIQGTSFGLGTTRIYLAAKYTDYAEPFLRIAVGTETEAEIDQLISLFKDVLG